MANNEPTVISFTRKELQVIFHALCLAETYYADPDAKVRGMHPATEELLTKRKADILPLVERITRYAATLL